MRYRKRVKVRAIPGKGTKPESGQKKGTQARNADVFPRTAKSVSNYEKGKRAVLCREQPFGGKGMQELEWPLRSEHVHLAIDMEFGVRNGPVRINNIRVTSTAFA